MYGFEKKETAEKLKKLVDPAFEPTAAERLQWTTEGAPQIRAYLAQPVEDIPGARRVKVTDSDGFSYNRLILGKGLVYIHERDVDGSEPADFNKVRRYPTRSDPSKRVEPYVRTAYNLCSETVYGDGSGESLGGLDSMLFCVEDIKGDLYIVKVCEYESLSSSSSGSSSSEGSSSEESSSEESSSEGSSSEESSSFGESSGSSSGSGGSIEECDYTGVVQTLKSISVNGGKVSFQTQSLTFRGGLLCSVEDGEAAVTIDLCNPECGSSSDGGSWGSEPGSEGSR